MLPNAVPDHIQARLAEYARLLRVDRPIGSLLMATLLGLGSRHVELWRVLHLLELDLAAAQVLVRHRIVHTCLGSGGAHGRAFCRCGHAPLWLGGGKQIRPET